MSQPAESCPHCCSDVHPSARVCSRCGATRRRTSQTTWRSAREGRRNDILVAGLGLVVILWLIGGMVVLFVNSTTRSSSTYLSPSCSISSPRWPNC